MNSSSTTYSSPAGSDEEISLSDLLDTLLQHIWLIVAIFLAALVVGVVYTFLATPIYSADALIQVEDKKSTMLSGVQEIADALGAGASPVSGEVEILRSREVVMKAVEVTHADVQVDVNRFPFVGSWLARRHDSSTGVAAPRLGFTSYGWGGEKIRVDELSVPESAYDNSLTLRATHSGFDLEDSDGKRLLSGEIGKVQTFTINGRPARIYIAELVANPGTEFEVTKVAPVTIYKSLLSRLTVGETSKQSGIIRISFESEDVDYAKSFVNAVARAYLRQNVERRSAEADQSLKFLDEQLPEIKRSVEKAEDALNAFRTRTNTVSVEKSTDTLLGRAVDVERGRLELQLKRDQLRQRFTPEHPELKAIEAQLAAVEREANGVNAQVNQLPASQRDLLRLQRDAEVNNQIYIALLNNVQQLKVAKAGTVGNVRIIDFAVRDSSPISPKKSLIVAIASILGLMCGIATVFVARVLRPTVRDVAEVERATGLTSYASVPESLTQERLDSSKRDKSGRAAIVDGRNQLLAILQPDDAAVESLRSLRTGLSFALMGAADKNIVITGATAALGKSFISANLSALLATAGKKVLLIETDMRRPQLGTYFGYAQTAGLSDLLAKKRTFDEVVKVSAAGVEGLDVLPSGQIPPNPGELLLSPLFSELVASVQDRYDHVILDSAPVLPVGDTLAVARCAATVFIVARAEVSTTAEVRDAVRKLQSAGVSVKGLIFNGIKRRRVGYGYTYKYYYGYGNK